MYVKGAEWSLAWEHWKLLDPEGTHLVMGTAEASARRGQKRNGLEDNHRSTGRMGIKRHFWA